MSIQAITWAWDTACETLASKLVLLHLADCANEYNSWACWPSLNSIMKFTGLTRQGVLNAIKSLQEQGLLEKIPPDEQAYIENEYGIVRKKSNVYRLLVPAQVKVSDAGADKREQKSCFLYVMKMRGMVKIGLSTNPASRIKSIQTSNPHQVNLIHTIERTAIQIRQLESACHAALKGKKRCGEWFEIDVDEVIEVVNSVDQKLFEGGQLNRPDQSTELTRLVNSVDPNLKEPEIEPLVVNKSTNEAESSFDVFWAQYPRKVAKPSALKAFSKARKVNSLETIMAGVAKHAAAWDANGTEKQFIPHPSTFLNQERYNDEPEQPGPLTAAQQREAEYLKFQESVGERFGANGDGEMPKASFGFGGTNGAIRENVIVGSKFSH